MVARISIVACLFLAACGGDESNTPDAEPAAFEDMTFEQREAFMEDTVMPRMTEIFVAFDPKFESMSCATCHGSGATDGSYAMPNSDVPPLPATEEAFYEELEDPEFARWAQFMLDKVWPEMASLLQVTMYDPTTGTDGFSCSNCHTLEGVNN